MIATFFFIVFAVAHPQAEKPVTDAEKKEFLKLLTTLPTRGEFFADEAIPKAAPYTRVLLALTEKDVGKDNLYPFLALSAGLARDNGARGYAAANFDKIAYPELKLGWAILLFRNGKPPPEVVAYLRKALETKKEIEFGLGPAFQDFREAVIRADEAGKRMQVAQHDVLALPEFGGSQTFGDFVLTPGGVAAAVHSDPKKQRGELVTYDPAKALGSRRLIPQPAGFKPKYAFNNYFEDARLSMNLNGDLLCFWTIEGNGDHAFALLKKGAGDFQVNRVASYLMGSQLVPAPDGSWFVVQSESGFFIILQVNKDLKLAEIGRIRRREASTLLDARFISKEVLLLFVTGEDKGQASLRTIDFDTKQRTVLHNRTMARLEPLAMPWNGSIVQTADGSLHYFWGILDRRDASDSKGQKRELLDGLYYQAEADGVTIKVGSSYRYRATALGDRIIVCSMMENAPHQAYFRVIRHGVVGPTTDLAIVKKGVDHLWTGDLILHANQDRIWFVNTLAPDKLYEMKLVDIKAP
jgi:hypothetical protein